MPSTNTNLNVWATISSAIIAGSTNQTTVVRNVVGDDNHCEDHIFIISRSNDNGTITKINVLLDSQIDYWDYDNSDLPTGLLNALFISKKIGLLVGTDLGAMAIGTVQANNLSASGIAMPCRAVLGATATIDTKVNINAFGWIDPKFNFNAIASIRNNVNLHASGWTRIKVNLHAIAVVTSTSANLSATGLVPISSVNINASASISPVVVLHATALSFVSSNEMLYAIGKAGNFSTINLSASGSIKIKVNLSATGTVTSDKETLNAVAVILASLNNIRSYT